MSNIQSLYATKFSAEGLPLVSIIVPTQCRTHQLYRLFESLLAVDFYNRYELIIVDNASGNDTAAVLAKYGTSLPIRVCRNEVNRSFSESCNQGAREAAGEYLLFLNDDMEVTENWLDIMLAKALQPDVGAVGAKLIYPGEAGLVQHGGIAFSWQGCAGGPELLPYNLGSGTDPQALRGEPREICAVTGACLLVNKALFLEVGQFDEHYEYGSEDVDFCLKLHRHGYRNYICPDAVLIHYEGGTQKREAEQTVKKRRLRNHRYFHARWDGYVAQHVLADKLQRRNCFTEEPLRVALAVDEAGRAMAWGMALEQFYGCQVQYLQMGEQYRPGVGTELLIAFEPCYDALRIRDANPLLLTCAWLDQEWEAWKQNAALPYFNYLLCGSETEARKVLTACGRRPDVLSGNNAAAFVRGLFRLLSERRWQQERRIAILHATPSREETARWGDSAFAEDLAHAFRVMGWQAETRCHDEWELPFIGRYVLVLRGRKAYVPRMEHLNVMWNISHPEEVAFREYNAYDLSFAASASYAGKASQKANTVVLPLLQCADPNVFTPIHDSCSCVSAASAAIHHELLFVGNTRGVFRKIIRDLLPTEHELAIYGEGWECYVPDNLICGQYISHEQLANVYASCDILLNDHWEDMRENGFLSNRLFDALAAGAFILSDAVAGLEEILPGCVATYDGTRADLQLKIDYYLRHPEVRRAYAERGQRLVREKHTYMERVRELVHAMEKMPRIR